MPSGDRRAVSVEKCCGEKPDLVTAGRQDHRVGSPALFCNEVRGMQNHRDTCDTSHCYTMLHPIGFAEVEGRIPEPPDIRKTTSALFAGLVCLTQCMTCFFHKVTSYLYLGFTSGLVDHGRSIRDGRTDTSSQSLRKRFGQPAGPTLCVCRDHFGQDT